MIPDLLTWCLCLAVLVIACVGGYQIGRLAEQDAQRQRRQGRAVRLSTLVRCPTCGAGPGEDCIPQGRRRVPTQRSPR